LYAPRYEKLLTIIQCKTG